MKPNKSIANIQYISQGKTAQEHLQNIEKVCQGGIRWVQLRLKDFSLAEIETTAQKALTLCRQYNVTFILNDHPEIAKKIEADGVHIGKKDMPPAKARKILSSEYIIGGTANTLEECLHLQEQGVDYIGVGPFRFTSTKKDLAPLLGLEGYQQLVEGCRKRQVNLPIIAVGGILAEDITPIKKTGVQGVALSGALTGNVHVIETISSIKKQLK